MEGVAVQHFNIGVTNIYRAQDDVNNISSVFFSHISDDSNQDAYITAEHIEVLLKELIQTNAIVPGTSTI